MSAIANQCNGKQNHRQHLDSDERRMAVPEPKPMRQPCVISSRAVTVGHGSTKSPRCQTTNVERGLLDRGGPGSVILLLSAFRS